MLTARATRLNHDGLLREIEVLDAIRGTPNSHPGDRVNLPRLLDRFEMDGPHGRHICLVLPVLSTDIGSFRRTSPSKGLSIRQVMRIIAQVVDATAALHSMNIIHTGKLIVNARYRC